MEFLNSWLQGIIIAVIITTIIEMILPNGNTKKYVKVVLGIYVVLNIMTPVVNKFFDSNFELSSIINIEDYMRKMESYEVSSKDINESNEDNIKQVYINSLKNDIKANLEEKEYKVKNIELEIENNETYKIKSILLYIESKQDKDVEEKKEESKVVINEIERVEIKIGETKKKDYKECNISDKDRKQIKEYLSSTYEISEKQIIIN